MFPVVIQWSMKRTIKKSDTHGTVKVEFCTEISRVVTQHWTSESRSLAVRSLVSILLIKQLKYEDLMEVKFLKENVISWHRGLWVLLFVFSKV